MFEKLEYFDFLFSKMVLVIIQESMLLDVAKEG